MSLSNITEADTLDIHLRGIDPAYRASATNYLALFTADPTETGSLSNEANYTGYARVALTKATAWTGTSSPFTNAALIHALTHFAVVDTASGAISQMISGALSSTLNVSAGIQPQFQAGTLSVGAD
jgi:hypothetical protein